ncbi:MAG: tlde1 domain-containing protein [Hyphomicrobiales bacterium]
MSYTTAYLDDVASLDDIVLPRRNFRPLALGAAVAGLGIVAAALVIVSMAATSMMLDAFTASPDMRAEAPVARGAAVLADSQDRPGSAIRSSAAAPIAIDPGRAPDSVIEAKLSPAAAVPRLAPPHLAATPSLAPPSSVTTTPSVAQLAPATTTPSVAPLPPVTAALSVAPLPPVRTTPSVVPPSVAAATGDVPLPPRRPAGLAATVPPPAEAPVASSVQPNPASAQPNAALLRPPSREARRQMASAPASVTEAPRQDNRNVFQRFFDALSGPSGGSLPGTGSRTALYDIAAHTVYMPNGERLEAHSGLGNRFDDPRSVAEKNRGVTPPNVYALELRKDLFHGVAALRLNPVDERGMYGRVGMLAHTYMLGPRGDSNGCVSFKDYKRFLEAFRSGEVTRLVVVANRASPVSVASAGHRQDGL